LGELPDGHRGLISNCSCLGEGVDVPALDGVAFIDPKGSIVDIIQAVGRVIRLSPDKTVGTIVIPVFVDETEDAEHALEDSAFDPVWQVLKALRAHDRRLADELDQLRTSLGKQAGGTKRIRLPSNIVLDVPRLLLKDFEQAFYVRAVARASERPPLTIEQILAWADEHKERTGEWPLRTTFISPINGESWSAINSSLISGTRGLPSGSSLSRLLAEYRKVPNLKALPPLSEDLIVKWAKEHKQRHGRWPNVYSGRIGDTLSTWRQINGCLASGTRGLAGGSSLATLLRQRHGVTGHRGKPKLTEKQILAWADQFKKNHNRWPTVEAGRIPGTDETWRAVMIALHKGGRGLSGGTSLPRLLAKHRQHRNLGDLETLSLDIILGWADDHKRRTGKWPKQSTGSIVGTNETWQKVNQSLVKGFRSLPGGSSLARLLAIHRGVRNQSDLPRLSEIEILKWADAHFRVQGEWPHQKSGAVATTLEKWTNINACLIAGLRGLPGGSSLARLLDDHRRT
jgi:hypothetical protein